MTNKRTAIPKALRQAVWLKTCGPVYEHKCYVKWCENKINPFNFECGHNIPFKHDGETTIENLFAICSLCNKSMGADFTIDQFSDIKIKVQLNDKHKNKPITNQNQMKRWYSCFICS